MINVARGVIFAAGLTVSCIALADPIVVEAGEHLEISSSVGNVILEGGASVTVNGGSEVGQIRALTNSTINVLGGDVGNILQSDEGYDHLNIKGGTVGSLAFERGEFEISGGSILGSATLADAFGTISGGTFSGPSDAPDPETYFGGCTLGAMCIFLDSLVTISGGVIDTAIEISTLQPNLEPDVFWYGLIVEGFNLELTPLDIGAFTSGYRLTGTLRDGNPIDTNIYGLRNYDDLPTFRGGANEIKLVEVPEPATLLLLALGLFGVMASRRYLRLAPIS